MPHGCALPDGTEVIASVAAQLALTEHLAPTLATVMRDRQQKTSFCALLRTFTL
jgi:hypothetical protein